MLATTPPRSEPIQVLHLNIKQKFGLRVAGTSQEVAVPNDKLEQNPNGCGAPVSNHFALVQCWKSTCQSTHRPLRYDNWATIAFFAFVFAIVPWTRVRPLYQISYYIRPLYRSRKRAAMLMACGFGVQRDAGCHHPLVRQVQSLPGFCFNIKVLCCCITKRAKCSHICTSFHLDQAKLRPVWTGTPRSAPHYIRALCTCANILVGVWGGIYVHKYKYTGTRRSKKRN